MGEPRTPERRRCSRQRVSFSFIQLENDNGGILLDISESGLSMQAVRSLTDDQVPHIRFLLPQAQPWVETRARVAWVSASGKTAGLEFIGLPDEARDQIKECIALELQLNESAKGTAFGEETELVNDVPATHEPENAIPLPETETIVGVPENPKPHSIFLGTGGVSPSVGSVSRYSKATSTTSGVAGSTRGTTARLRGWPEMEARIYRDINARKRTSFSRAPARLIGLSIATGLLLLALAFLSYHLRRSTYRNQQAEPTPSAKVTEPSTATPAIPTNLPVDQPPPADRSGFMLQVGAMTYKENADALAEVLQRRNFPAGVSPPGTDRFYRVVVGPYGDADSMLRAKEELKAEGLESIRKPVRSFTEQPANSAGLH